MKDLTVINQNGILLVDSREVADMIGKRHADLLESIKGYITHLTNGKFRSLDFFIESTYQDNKGEDRPCYLLTRKGCDMVANKMTGEKGVLFTAAYVTKFEEMEEALKDPFHGMSKELRAIFVIDQKQQELDNRVLKLENTMTIDYSQQEELRTLVNKTVTKTLGYDTPAYKELSKKAFSSIWKDYKRVLDVNSYKNTAVKDFDKAKTFLKSWNPSRELELMIIGANSQLSM